ncbi:MAG: hypothetical protein ACJ71G_04755 [Nitrososphaeraceae archaeon]
MKKEFKNSMDIQKRRDSTVYLGKTLHEFSRIRYPSELQPIEFIDASSEDQDT